MLSPFLIKLFIDSITEDSSSLETDCMLGFTVVNVLAYVVIHLILLCMINLVLLSATQDGMETLYHQLCSSNTNHHFRMNKLKTKCIAFENFKRTIITNNKLNLGKN